ncbi:DUF997 family protein [Xiamenia xianingshaonis]|uniref:DUF997 family protein n=1 Tax=Xiamenia xianingshaonis TaxID=2682776 RepID=A0A9E6MQ97_9ACTN|nr:DUF997 family protein [Xiamenia xianingshaonis]NHM14500.1 DUF997 family protein [Xiamenia xianingshaonis]QTU83791.1 YhdT family protein [Xiamenia xianingshaonis]
MGQRRSVPRTYREKMREANREAVASVVALAVIVAVWLAGGIGLASVDVSVAGLPIWVIGGTFGPWIVSIVLAVVLAGKVFVNFSLDDEEGADGE